MPRFSEPERATIWAMREAEAPVKGITRHLGRQNSSLRKFIADAGGNGPARGNALSSGSPSKNEKRSPRHAFRGIH